MNIQQPELRDMIDEVWQRFSARTGITAKHDSAIAYNIVVAFCMELYRLWEQLGRMDAATNISSATGSSLDAIGQFFGVFRRLQSYATSIGTTAKVKFTNNTQSIINIPAGTHVWPGDDQSKLYRTTNGLILNPGAQGYVDVTAILPGASYNVPANALNKHDLGIEQLTVTNELPIATGAESESDEEYRMRIVREVLRRESANIVAVKEALLEVPGVRDALIINYARGPGTLDAYIYVYGKEVPEGVLAECQQVLDETVAAGISAQAKAPKLVYVDVAVMLKLKAGTVLDHVKAGVASAISGYIDNLPIEDGTGNGTLIYQELTARIQEASPSIVDSSVSITIDGMPGLRTNQTLDIGERFVTGIVKIT